MTATNNLGMTLVEQSQSQKEVTVNEALVLLDSIGLQARGVIPLSNPLQVSGFRNVNLKTSGLYYP